MENLSHLFRDGPVAALTGGVSEAATNTISQPPPFAAPGTPSESTRYETPGDPSPSATAYDTPVLLDAAGTKITPDNADRSNPFTEPDGSGRWRSGRDSAEPLGGTVPRPVLRMGQWNEL